MNKTLIFPSARALGRLPAGGESAERASPLDDVNVSEKDTEVYDEPCVWVRLRALSCSIKTTIFRYTTSHRLYS